MNATGTAERLPDAVVWLDEQHAIVARRDPADRISTTEVRRRQQPEPRYLASVVHEIAGQQHVLVIGPAPIRLALERRFVAVTHRPDRLISRSGTARAEGARLIESVAAIAA